MRPIQPSELFASVVEEGQEQEFLSYDFKTNVEIAYFSQSRVLDGVWQEKAELFKQIIDKKRLRCTLHGPFYEMGYQTKDGEIRRVVEKRYGQILEVARFMAAELIVIHSTYNPLSAQPDSVTKWVRASADFLKPFAERAGELGITLALENIYDTRPEPIKELIRTVGLASLKACIDMGHWFLFSKMSIKEWVDVYGEDLGYFHLHDNQGVHDDHDAIGSGKIPFGELFEALASSPARPKFSIEVRTVDRIDRSLDYLRGQGWLCGPV